ncbi:MAG: 50S ribosomal protein L25 [Dehalococcoidia bacterium]|nr:50S ribosomal protein L25 [Dehalococcoidia bacterium]
MPDTYQVQPRTTLGKAVKKLRREGVLPASIYGRGLDSVAVQLPYVVGRDLMNKHGYNLLVNLAVEGEEKPRPVVVKQVAQDPVSRALWHIDFLQVDLTRKIAGPVPIVFVGEAPAVKDHHGVLVIHSDTVEVEALPADMPESLEISLEVLEELDSYLYAGQIQTPPGVEVITDAEHLLAAITRPRVLSDEDGDEVVEGEQATEAAAEAAADGEAPEGD